MLCVYCDKPTSVENSRPLKRNNGVWRRRKCTTCYSIFTTHETAHLSTVFMVEQKNGKLEPFEHIILLTSIYDCAKHLPNAALAASELTNTIVLTLLNKKDAVLTRNDIIQSTSPVLRRFNEAVAVQYGAFHPITSS